MMSVQGFSQIPAELARRKLESYCYLFGWFNKQMQLTKHMTMLKHFMVSHMLFSFSQIPVPRIARRKLESHCHLFGWLNTLNPI